MVDRRKRGRAVENIDESGPAANYEQFREQRVKENKERMHKLGIFDLSLKLKSSSTAPKRLPKNPSDNKAISKVPTLEPSRRSSRLKSLSPVSYAEMRPKRSDKHTSKSIEIYIKEGSQPEIYTEEDVKLLGDCNSTWTLFVDGYDQHGKRLYDPVDGETCHQCRQKTLGRHTHCSKCNLVQGQLCGDCLYMRYGENVMEVIMNPEWLCPVCRGICNCSLCRKTKGWAPTGALYRKVCKLGFKSVAHYLIQTRCGHTNVNGLSTENSVDVDSTQALADQGLVIQQHDDSLTSFDDPDLEGEGDMEEAHFLGSEYLNKNDMSKKTAINDSDEGKSDGA